MLLKHFIFEEVVIAPRNMRIFLSSLEKSTEKTYQTLEALQQKMELLVTTEDENGNEESDHKRELTDIIWDNAGSDISYDRIKYFVATTGKLLSKFKDVLNYVIQATIETDRLSALFSFNNSTIQILIEDMEQLIEQYSRGILELELGSESKNYYRSYSVYDSWLKLAKEQAKIIQGFFDSIKLVSKKIKRKEESLSGTDDKLKHKFDSNTQTMYHATANATTLMKSGFKTNINQEVEGLGGQNTDSAGQAAISFTVDLYVAKEVARTLKEAIMIAKGQVTGEDVLSLAAHEGIEKEIIQGSFVRTAQEIIDGAPDVVFEAFKAYLATSRKRYDPVYIGSSKKLMGLMRTKNEEDVGVLVCTVDVTNQNIKYLHSMEEYRVPPSAVVSIDKVLK